MEQVRILILPRLGNGDLERIASVDGRLKVVDARGLFDGEILQTWPGRTGRRFVKRPEHPESTRQERDLLLSTAEVILGGYPYPLDLHERAPRLRWFHQLPAGANNLRHGDLWGKDLIATTSRGYGNTHAMAEYVLAGFLHFSRGLHLANRDSRRHHFDRSSYHPVTLQGKTVCIVGAGGVGMDVALLCKGVEMRVVGTRRSTPPETPPSPTFHRIEGPDGLLDLLAESEYVAVCCQWTPQSTKIIGREAFEAMRPGTVLVNVARGEIIDEEALIDALSSGTLMGVALDVYVDEMKGDPDPRLWEDERVVITPHVSGGTDRSQHRGIDLFCENLGAYLEGRPLVNAIDWERGY